MPPFSGSTVKKAPGFPKIIIVFVLIFVLLLALLVFLLVGAKKNEEAPPPPPVEQQPVAQVQEILISAGRIESGVQISDLLLSKRALAPGEVIEGAILVQDVGLVRGQYTKEFVQPGAPIILSNLSQQPTSRSAIIIPKGYRAMTIQVDRTSGVNFFAMVNSRVDILWTFSNDDRKKEVTTLVKFVRIIAVEDSTTSYPGQQPTASNVANINVTLQVTEDDARKIELARNTGSLSLILAGEADEIDTDGGEENDSIDEGDIKNKGKPTETENCDGTMYTTDPVTGKKIRMCLKKGRWTKDESF